MAFPPRTAGERPKSLIFRTPAKQPEEPSGFTQYTIPLSPGHNTTNNARVAPQPESSAEMRNALQRRFTTNALPNLAPIGDQRRKQNEGGDTNNAANNNKMSATEKKTRQYEALLAQQRRIQAEMALIDPETRREVDEARKLEDDISLFTSELLNESETRSQPRVPSLQTSNMYTNRFSNSSLASPAFSAQPSRTGSQITSPPAELTNTYFPSQNLPSQSVPTSQHNSDHEADSDDDYKVPYSHSRQKSGANPNRNSMPAFDHLLRHNPSLGAFSNLVDSTDYSNYLQSDDTGRKSKRSSQIISGQNDGNTILQLHQTEDEFPILVRRPEAANNSSLFGSAMKNTDEQETSNNDATLQRTDKSIAAKHRQSLPPSAMRGALGDGMAGIESFFLDATTARNTAANRNSLEVKFTGLDDLKPKRSSLALSPGAIGSNALIKSSPVPASSDNLGQNNFNNGLGQNNHVDADHARAGETFADTYADLSEFSKSSDAYTISPQAAPFVSPDMSSNAGRQRSSGLPSNTSGAPNGLQNSRQDTGPGAGMTAPVMSNYVPANPTYDQAYAMQLVNQSFGQMNLSNQHNPWQMPNSQYQTNFQGYNQGNRDATALSQQRGPPSRRPVYTEELSHLSGASLESLKGEIYGLCKDQHGCRFLQKQLEERNPEHTRMIFEETLPHVIELMTDPFGNYLCQKMLEFADDHQRTALIRAASPYMVRIALNQHGTRALQKMIEYITTQEQIDLVIEALRNEVVQLIQDLNGNHVIQKCLNHLQGDDVQFIIDAVCAHVVAVGTHRHGCCVLQRCIDHASAQQKGQLVASITNAVFALVQDPFGNYVVQYIFDLSEPAFSAPLCERMVGSVSFLARQKFSSNVMEKGIRTAHDGTRRLMIEEMLHPVELHKMLRDSFANYVVQTAMDYADDDMKIALIEAIRPVLPAIRHTPHGRRIQTKIQDYDIRNGDTAVYAALSAQDAMSLPPTNGHVLDGYQRNAGYMVPGYPINNGNNSNMNPMTYQNNMNYSFTAPGAPMQQSPVPQVPANNGFGYPNGNRFNLPFGRASRARASPNHF